MTSITTAQRVLGVDIGGTTIRAGVVSVPDGRLCDAIRRAPTPPGGEPELLQATLADLRRQLDEAGLTWNTIGVALPGLLDPAGQALQKAVNLPRLESVPLERLLSAALGAPPRIETDVIAAGWAQWRAGGASAPRCVYLSLGTGIGGAVILGGQILRQTNRGAGQLGHLLCDPSPDAPRCRCGGRGCLEAIWRERPAQRAQALAVALVNLARIFAPTEIILGGGGIDHGLVTLADVQAAFAGRCDALTPPGLTLRAAPLTSDEAGVIGAALLANAPPA